MANFGSKNETFAYLVGKDIAEIKAKIEGIGTTSGGLDVLKIVVPAVEGDLKVNLPSEFKNSICIQTDSPNNFTSFDYVKTSDELSVYGSGNEYVVVLVKLFDDPLTNTKYREVKATLTQETNANSGGVASDA